VQIFNFHFLYPYGKITSLWSIPRTTGASGETTEFIIAISYFWYNKAFETQLPWNQPINGLTKEILNLNKSGRYVEVANSTIHETFMLLKTIAATDIRPSKIDMGRLPAEWLEEKRQLKNPNEFSLNIRQLGRR